MARVVSNKLVVLAAPVLAAIVGCTSTITAPGDGVGGPSSANAGGSSGAGATTGKGGSSGSAGSVTGSGGTSGASGAAGSGTGGTQPTAGPRPVNLEGETIYSRMLRLTVDQWENSVHDILRLTAPTGVSQNFQRAVGATPRED